MNFGHGCLFASFLLLTATGLRYVHPRPMSYHERLIATFGSERVMGGVYGLRLMLSRASFLAFILLAIAHITSDAMGPIAVGICAMFAQTASMRILIQRLTTSGSDGIARIAALKQAAGASMLVLGVELIALVWTSTLPGAYWAVLAASLVGLGTQTLMTFGAVRAMQETGGEVTTPWKQGFLMMTLTAVGMIVSMPG